MALGIIVLALVVLATLVSLVLFAMAAVDEERKAAAAKAVGGQSLHLAYWVTYVRDQLANPPQIVSLPASDTFAIQTENAPQRWREPPFGTSRRFGAQSYMKGLSPELQELGAAG